MKLNVNEVFASINGEVNRWGQGSPTVFVRLQGCNLKCPYCDTAYAQSTGDYDPITIKHLLTEIESYGIRRVTITGGEPLLQENVYSLIDTLSLAKYQISIETNGSVKIKRYFYLHQNVCYIVDYKIDFSAQMIEENYLNLCKDDYVKFVIGNKTDFDKAIQIKNNLQKNHCIAKFAFSPVNANPEFAGILAGWLIENRIDDVILNVQIHKIIQVK